MQGVRTVKAFVFIQREVFFSRRFDLLLQFIGLALNIIFIGIFAKLITINANIAQYGTPNYLDYLTHRLNNPQPRLSAEREHLITSFLEGCSQSFTTLRPH
ncbi:hypothetical protein [Thermococcus piezophilus]|uniref:hypothetical protein n=1 Tax=Thermococcus piezophilus TaxID=1712654 RepID=UPI000AD0089F|nr:hypothetical protein [Thermococcus piezophilus]